MILLDVVVLLGVAVALLWPPVYKSTATILIEQQEAPTDFVMTTADGTRLERARYLKDLERGTTTFAPVPDPAYKVLVYGQTAVHLGEANRMSTGSDGGSILVHMVWTDTWVRTSDGRWVLLAAQVAVAPAK